MDAIEIKEAPDGGIIVERLPETSLKPAPVAQPSTAAPDPGPAIDRAIQSWLTGHIYGSQVSGSTAVYNHLTSTLPALKTALLAELKTN